MVEDPLNEFTTSFFSSELNALYLLQLEHTNNR